MFLLQYMYMRTTKATNGEQLKLFAERQSRNSEIPQREREHRVMIGIRKYFKKWEI